MWIQNAREAILASSQESSIYIGADSVCYKKGTVGGKPIWFARYATAIVVHMDSCHGCRVFYNVESRPDFRNIRARMLTEVQFSLDAYDAIKDVIGDRYLEIHIDVNSDPIHASNVAANEASGWVKGMGLNHRIKNDAWAASTAADYLANGRLKNQMPS